MELEKVVADLLQKIERRFFGKYRGLVVDNGTRNGLVGSA